MGALRNGPSTLFFQENVERTGGFQAFGNKPLVKSAWNHGLFKVPSNVKHITRIRGVTGYQAAG